MSEQPPSLKPEFLTTQKAAECILDIIDSAKNRIVLISPYVNPKEIIFVKLEEASKKGKQILLVCNEKSLTAGVKQRIISIINLKLLNHGHAHAKCYYNEEKVMYTSLNLLESSENKNMELGILIKRAHDQEMYYSALAEPEKIVSSCLTRINANYKSSNYSKYQNSTFHNFDKYKIREFIEIPGKKGVCIRCKTGLNYLNGSLPLCTNCYRIWIQFFNFNYVERFCHWCANKNGTSKRKPFCSTCYKNYQVFENTGIIIEPLVEIKIEQPPPIPRSENIPDSRTVFPPPIPQKQIITEETPISDTANPEIRTSPVEKKSYWKYIIYSFAVIAISIGSWLLYNHFKNGIDIVKNHDEILAEIINNYFSDINQQPVKVAKYFAPTINTFIKVKNLTPNGVDSLIKVSSGEFMYGKSSIIDSTLSISKDPNGYSAVSFWINFKCFRASKVQFEKCKVHEEFLFDENDKIVSVKELGIEDLKFSFKDPDKL